MNLGHLRPLNRGQILFRHSHIVAAFFLDLPWFSNKIKIMLEHSVLISVRKYLAALKEMGTDVELAVVFGSQATGKTHPWSDIDLLVVSPLFDDLRDRGAVNLLWRLAARIDSRIEPIPCGSRQWREDDSSAIIEIARREGQILDAA